MPTQPFRTAAVAAAICALLIVPAFAHASPPQHSLAWLLAKHKEAVQTGAEAAPAAPLKTVYAITAAGLTGSLTEWTYPPDKDRLDMVLGPLRQTQADDGTTAWQQDSTGNVRIVRGDELTEERADSFSLESYDPLRSNRNGKVTLRRKREAGTGAYILDVALVGAPAQTIYIDPKSFLITKMLAAKGGISGTILIDRYLTVCGQKIPSVLHISYNGLPIMVDATLQSAEPIKDADLTLFQPPPSSRDNELVGHPGTQSVTVPYTDDNGEILLPVRINGHDFRFILDSGAANSFVTAQAAEQIGLAMRADMPAAGYGGSASTGIATQTTVEIPGAARMDRQILYVIKDDAIAKALKDRGGIDGALGYDLLARFVVTVDYEHKTVSLQLPDTYRPPPGSVVLPVTLSSRTPEFLASVDGKAPGRFILDTGDSGAVHLYTQYAQSNGMMTSPLDPRAHRVTEQGLGGPVDVYFTPGHTLKLGGIDLTDVPVGTSSAAGVSSFMTLAGGVGNIVLGRFRVTFDYRRQRVVLEKPDDFVPAVSPNEPSNSNPNPPATPEPGAASATGEPFARPAAFVSLHGVTANHEIRSGQGEPAGITTSEILARHLAALGGRNALEAIHSTEIDQIVQTGGLRGTVVSIYQAPDYEFEEDKLGITDTIDGYNGKTAWERDTNGNMRLFGEDERKELQLELYIDTNSYVLPDEGIPGTVSLRPRREPGTGDYILDAAPTGGKPCVLYLDPKTFLISKEQHLEDDVLVTTTCTDYRKVDGVEFPFRQRTSNGEARYDIELTATRVINNGTYPAAMFAPPAGGGSADSGFVDKGAHSASCDFDFDDDEIGIPVAINGTPERLFLDSGASGLALTQDVANALHLKQAGVLEARGYGGSTDLHPVKVESLEIGNAVYLHNIAAVSISLPDGFGESLAHPLAGFIGYDLLAKFVVRVDYANHRVTFIAPDQFTPSDKDGTALTLNLDNDIPSITAQFDTLPPAQYLLDTGDVSALRLYGPYVTQNNLDRKYPGGTISVGGGVGGESRSKLVCTDHFTVAGTTLSRIPTEFSQDTKGGASQVLAGSLGSQLLSRFIVTFDYPHGKVYFAPNADASQPFDTRTFGLTVEEVKDTAGRPHFVIVDVDPRSPAAKAGVLQYDQILNVDDKPAAQITLQELHSLFSPQSGAESYVLHLFSPKGERHTATISLYDPYGSAAPPSAPVAESVPAAAQGAPPPAATTPVDNSALSEGLQVSFMSPGATTLSIPLSVIDGRVRIPEKIMGNPGVFILDSGAGGTVISADLVKKLNLKTAGQADAHGFGGDAQVPLVNLDSIDIADQIRLSHLTVGIAPDALLYDPAGPLAGVTGYDLLHPLVMTLDFAGKQLTITDPAAFQPGQADGPPLPLTYSQGQPDVTAQVDDLKPEKFVVDTGYEHTVWISRDYAEKNNLLGNPLPGPASPEQGIGGKTTTRRYVIPRFTIGDITMQGMTAEIPDDDVQSVPDGMVGIIGMDVLLRMRVTFDYPHNKLYLALPPSSPAQAPQQP